MSIPTDQELEGFANALQLCLAAKINAVVGDSKGGVVVNFNDIPEEDIELKLFMLLVKGKWKENKKSYEIENASEVDWAKITSLLLVTRLSKDNILNLAEREVLAQKLVREAVAQKILSDMNEIESDTVSVVSVQELSRFIFGRLEEKKMTIRELSEKTGLTQTALSNFKSGKDIRFSSLLKIASALKLKLYMK
jgi:hypothetical protein